MPEHACPAFRYDPLHGDYYLTGKKKAAVFLRHFILKLIFLPRQARDKHRESTQNKDAFPAGGGETQGGPYRSKDLQTWTKSPFAPLTQVRNTFFCRQPSSFLLKNDDVLPRQARDKHNEALLTKTKTALAQNSVALAKAQMQTLADRDAKIGPYYTERWGQLPPTGERTKTPRFAMQVSHLRRRHKRSSPFAKTGSGQT